MHEHPFHKSAIFPGTKQLGNRVEHFILELELHVFCLGLQLCYFNLETIAIGTALEWCVMPGRQQSIGVYWQPLCDEYVQETSLFARVKASLGGIYTCFSVGAVSQDGGRHFGKRSFVPTVLVLV